MPVTSGFSSNRYLRLLLVVVAVGTCVWTIRAAANFGMSRLFVRYALVTRSQEAARMATQLTPNDAHAQITAATLANISGAHAETLSAVERAVAVRPSDYSLWIALGQIRDQLGNTSGALAAFDQAVKLAPFYSQPYWQRGNLLLRAGQYDAAFKDLNYAVLSNPDLIPKLLELAWGLSQGDPAKTEAMVRIESPRMHMAFAQLLAREGKTQEALAHWQHAGTPGEALQRELLRRLLERRAFKEALVVWQAGKPAGAAGNAPVVDGGFEGTLVLNAEGFGWIVPANLKGVNLSLDATERHSGAKSILLSFQGASESASPLLSQLAIVQPSTRYKLNFAARSQEIVSGGPPIVVVKDASDGKLLGQSAPLNKGTAAWQVFGVEFTALPETTAVVFSVQRESCTTPPCPIFGSLWLDSFSLEPLK